MKKILYVLCLVTPLLWGCNKNEHKDDSFRIKRPISQTKQMIDANINKLGASRWDKNNYLEIRDNQIGKTNLSKNAKDALIEKLERVYGQVLVKEGNLLMDNNCGKNHKQLSKVMEELKGFPKAEKAAELKNRYKEHQDLLAFANSISAPQNPRSYNDNYDYGFEKRIKNQAQAYLKKDIKCTEIKNKLSNYNAAFSTRCRNFCGSIVKLY